MNEPKRVPKQISRRRFLIGGAGVAAATVGAYTLAGWIEEETYQPQMLDLTQASPWQERTAPQQPIALLIDPDASTSFGLYLGEVLRSEGLNAFQFESVDRIDTSYLANYAVVLLPPVKLSQSQAAALADYVMQGGALIAMRPDALLAPIFGVRRAEATTSGGYMLLHEEKSRPLQIHTETQHYTLDNAKVLADLYLDRETASGFAAITQIEYASGKAVMFAYDVAHNIALTRQGNPQSVNRDRDGAEGVRANDMFVDWLDLENMLVPQADLQARLLVNLIENALGDHMPLPRLWYFPEAAASMLIVTGDAHGASGATIDDALQTVESYDGQATVYYTPPLEEPKLNGLRRSLARVPLFGWVEPQRNGRPTPEVVNNWRARGHEFSAHPYVEEGVDDGYAQILRAFRRDGYLSHLSTVRTHRILWNGWVETARVQAQRGFRMNVDYYHIGPAFRAADGSWPVGHFIGSGLPMKFVDEQGQLIDVYQQPTQLVDEHWLATTNRGWAGLNGKQAAQVACELIDASVDGAHAALTLQYHMDSAAHDQAPYQNAHEWLVSILSHARDHALPIWSAERWLNFVEMRHDATFSDLHWDAAKSTLSFALDISATKIESLSMMLPTQFGERRLSEVRIDGQMTSNSSKRAVGREYTWINTTSEPHKFLARYELVS